MIETTATIKSKKSLTPDVVEFVIQPEVRMPYIPGQFFMIKLQTPEGKVQYRSYSLANHPSDADNTHLRMVIKLIDGGLCSEKMRKMKAGDELTVRGCSGIFTFRSQEAQKINMICTGTGIVPLVSMIEHELLNGNTSQFHLYFGNRYRVDLFWIDILDSLKEQYPNFDYSVILSKPDAMWHGAQGYVTELVKENLEPAAHYYLCGIPAMVDDVKNMIKEAGISKDHIFEEKFVSVGETLKARANS